MKRKSWYKITISTSYATNILLCIALVLTFYYFRCFKVGIVSGDSMYPTLKAKERIYTSEAYKSIWGIQRGDIVTARVNILDRKEDIVKRVIGVPYDRIQIKDNVVTINGRVLDEPYVSELNYTDGEVNIILLNDEYFLMGDNRSVSLDSRDQRLGVVKKEQITSVVLGRKDREKQ